MPKVIDLPTATSMTDSDYLIMEASGGGTKKITRTNALVKDIVTGAASVSSLASGTTATLASCTLTKGVWIVTAQTRFNNASGNYRIIASISLSGALEAADGGFIQISNTTGNYAPSFNMVRVLNITAASQTVNLVGQQNSGGSIGVSSTDTLIKAIRIA